MYRMIRRGEKGELQVAKEEKELDKYSYPAAVRLVRLFTYLSYLHVRSLLFYLGAYVCMDGWMMDICNTNYKSHSMTCTLHM